MNIYYSCCRTKMCWMWRRLVLVTCRSWSQRQAEVSLPSVYLSVRMSIHPSYHQSRLSIYFVFLSVGPFICSSVRPFICLSVCLFIHSSVCLFVFLPEPTCSLKCVISPLSLFKKAHSGSPLLLGYRLTRSNTAELNVPWGGRAD